MIGLKDWVVIPSEGEPGERPIYQVGGLLPMELFLVCLDTQKVKKVWRKDVERI